MSDSNTEITADHPPASQQGMRRKWMPVLWVGVPAVIVAVLWKLDVDPGVTNTFIHAAVFFCTLGLAAWVVRYSGWSAGLRWTVALVPAAAVVSYYAQLSPIETIIDGDVGVVGWRWRWDAPDKKLAAPDCENSSTADCQVTANDYPRFLGKGYWAEVPQVKLESDWDAHPPRELWRKKIGAGWSAFAIVGGFAFTQEQRAESELVTCYDIQTGDVVWSHADAVRWDPGGTGALGYAGPRATPTVHDGKVFAQGATGILNCLDARTGQRLWSHDTLSKHDAENVNWGKACSPLIVDDLVVVSVGGANQQSVVAYKMDTGEVAWASGTYQSSYASPVLAELAGVRQVVSVDEGYVTSRRADDGQPLWEFPWPSDSGGSAACSQPIPLADDRVFVSKGYGQGSVLLQLSRGQADRWQIQPVWPGGVKTVMKTKMGNVVVRDGYVYGIDDVNLQCIELETGKKQWKKRRRPKIGHGQIMLIGDHLLVLTEHGELVLIDPSPDEYRELASTRVFDEKQITWNNPAFSSPYLLVRNAEEAACYELPLAEGLDMELANNRIARPR